MLLTADEIRMILDKIGREVVVEATQDFPFEVITPRSQGYHSDGKVSSVQTKLSIMLEAASRNS